jgi:hypothetical protein
MKKLFLAISTLMLGLHSNAQVNSLIFSAQQGLFTEIVNYPNSGVTTHTLIDDYVIPSKVAIPFSFNFSGKIHDSLNISENGFIWFGTQDISMHFDYFPISTVHDTAIKGVVAPLGSDLEPHKHANLVTTLKSGAVGAAPNRIFIIEWLNTSRYNVDPTGDTLDFQIKLYESTGEIEFVYGFFNLDKTLFAPLEVGLKGDDYSDFNNRTIYTGNWNSTSAGVSQSAICNLDSVTMPNPGQLFRWNNNPSSVLFNEGNVNKVVVYPNPFETYIKVNTTSNISEKYYQVLDLSGTLVKEGKFNSEAIDLGDLPSSTYILVLKCDDKVTRKSIIKH